MEESRISLDLLDKNTETEAINIDEEKKKIEEIFYKYDIKITCVDVVVSLKYYIYKIDLRGRYKIKDIVSLQAEIGMFFDNIEQVMIKPITGTNLLGIFLKKRRKEKLLLGTLLGNIKEEKENNDIPLTIGLNINGEKIVKDLCIMPHMLISGTTGSGKTTLIDSIITQIVFKFTPDELKMLLIDTKGISLPIYNKIPYLLVPTVTDSVKAYVALQWVTQELKNRYELFSKKNVREIKSYNKVSEDKIPRIVVIIDDFADLCDTCPNKTELQDVMKILSQEARAAGIHLIISTYRPSTEIMKGIIKSNIPCRLSLKMATYTDSMVVLDEGGAEELNKGEALLKTNGCEKAELIDVPFISEKNVSNIVNCFTGDNIYNSSLQDCLTEKDNEDKLKKLEEKLGEKIDPFLMEAIDLCTEVGQASTSFIQRRFKIGYARAGKIIDQMEKIGILSKYEGSKPRKVLITGKEWSDIKKDYSFEKINNIDKRKYLNDNQENNEESIVDGKKESSDYRLAILFIIITLIILIALN